MLRCMKRKASAVATSAHDQRGVGARAGDERAKQSGLAEEDGLREVEAHRIAQRAGDEIVEELQRNARQHEGGEDLVGVAAGAQRRRDAGPEGAGEPAGKNHRRQEQRRGGGLEGDGERPGGDRADDELAFGADVPDLRAVADRQPLRDQEQRPGLQKQLPDAVPGGQRLHEEGVGHRRRRAAEQAEEDRAGEERRGERDERHRQRGGARALGARLEAEVKHARPASRRRPAPAPRRSPPWQGRRHRGSSARVATAGERLPRNITCSRSVISKSSSSSSETTRIATPAAAISSELLAHEGGGADIEPPGRLRYEQELWAELDLAADDEFLQVAAGKAARRRLRAAAAHVVAGDDAARGGLQPVEADHAAPRKVGIARR